MVIGARSLGSDCATKVIMWSHRKIEMTTSHKKTRAGRKKSVGIRELKAQASAIVTHVSETRATYEVTRRGKVEALIVPVDVAPNAELVLSDAAWSDFLALARELSKLKTEKSALAELEAMRR